MTMRSEGVAPAAGTSCPGPSGPPAAAVALFRSLGDPSRLAILLKLAEGEARVTDLVDAVGLAQSTVSAHLACLRDCGLVDSQPQGRSSRYFLARPELLDLLRSAEGLLAATGQAVALCSTYGTAPAVAASTVATGEGRR